MKRLLGCSLAAFLMLFPLVAVLWVGSVVAAFAGTIHCPMPADCNTTATMDTWYACKARQIKAESPVVQQKECIAKLRSMGAGMAFTIKACGE
jgi:hypothetical protein